MIALDTNVLVRLLTRDDAKQAESARTLLEQYAEVDDALYVSDIVLAELVWTLDRTYGLSRAQIARTVDALVNNATLQFESRAVLRTALQSFVGSKAGFVDCLILAKAKSAGCVALVTFDKALYGLAGVRAV